MKKRLLFIIWSFSYGGGAEKQLATLVNGLDSNKYDIDNYDVKEVIFNVNDKEITKSVLKDIE